MSEAVLGLRYGTSRLRAPRLVVVFVLAWAITAAVAMAEHVSAPISAPSRTLHAVWGAVVPLSALALVNAVFDGDRVDRCLWGLARFGWSRRRLAWSATGLVMAVSVALSMTGTAVGLVVAYLGTPGLGSDLGASLPAAAAGGAAYAAWFSFGATFMRRGGGRFVPLVVDWLVGGGVGVLSLPWPRAHLQSLAGGPAVFDLPQPLSSVVLWAMALGLWAATGWRSGD